MVIGVPKEIKKDEYRVAMAPSGVRALTDAGHGVVVEKGAGEGSSIADAEFTDAGAEIVDSAEDAWAAGLVVKVKDPIESEFGYFRDDLTVFTFLHLAANPELADALLEKGVTSVAYETVQRDDGILPVLMPMSEVAGRLAVQAGAHALMRPCGGLGVLPGGVPGVERGRITVIGAGTVGWNATKITAALGSEVTVMDINLDRFRRYDDIFPPSVVTMASNAHNLEAALRSSDMLIGAVHSPGARTPTLVTREMLGLMKKGAVIVDVSVDQGGCVETIRPTTHGDPTYEVDGIVHYGVANMPGAVPRTSTFALTNATLAYLLKLASHGAEGAASADPALRRGINTLRGRLTHHAVARALGRNSTPVEKA